MGLKPELRRLWTEVAVQGGLTPEARQTAWLAVLEKMGIGNPQGSLEELARRLQNDGFPLAAAQVMLYADTGDAAVLAELASLLRGLHPEAIVGAKEYDYVVKGLVEEQRITVGVVYMPNEADLQREWASREVIEKAAHDWLANYRKVDAEHSWQEGSGTPVESYIAPCDIYTYFGKRLDEPITEGSWVVAVRWSEPMWEKVKKGDIRGYSLGGLKRLSPKSMPPPAHGGK